MPSGIFSEAEKETKQVNIITSDCNKSQEEDKAESRARERWGGFPRKMTSALRPDRSQRRSHAGFGDKRVPEKVSNRKCLETGMSLVRPRATRMTVQLGRTELGE